MKPPSKNSACCLGSDLRWPVRLIVVAGLPLIFLLGGCERSNTEKPQENLKRALIQIEYADAEIEEPELFRSGWVECLWHFVEWRGSHHNAGEQLESIDCVNIFQAASGPLFRAEPARRMLARRAGFDNCRDQLLKLKEVYSDDEIASNLVILGLKPDPVKLQEIQDLKW